MLGTGTLMLAVTAASWATLPWATPSAEAVDAQDTIALVIKAGRPLRVLLEKRLKVKKVGQPITAKLVEPVYVHDRVVVPAGSTAVGHIAALKGPSAGTRILRILALDLTPVRGVVLEFDRLILPDGREVAMATRVGAGTPDVVLETAPPPPKKGLAGRAGDEVAKEARGIGHAVAEVKKPGKLRRLKDAVVGVLPVHPQYLREGTVYDAELLAPLDFGTAPVTARAPPGTTVPPESVLNARLTTAVGSATSVRGSPIEAVLTKPVLSSGGQLILPEGSSLTGEVTLARPARRMHHNGELRILFDAVRVPEEDARTLMASLSGVEAPRRSRLAIDDEGGATVQDTKARFAGPVLSVGAAAASMMMEPVTGPGEVEPGVLPGALEPNAMGTAAGGFSGFGIVGAFVSQSYRPLAIGLAVVGVARSVHSHIIGKGRDVSFRAGTRIQVQLPAANPSEP
jgi:hypothetical protein